MTTVAQAADESRAALPVALWPLLFGNFVIGSGVMVVPGTLNEISSSLEITPAVAGLLITAAASVMCFGAPLLAAAVSGWDRRRLLALSMLWYAALLGLSAVMPSYHGLMVARVLSMVAPAIFTPQAAACVGMLVPLSQRGRAVTFVFLGWSIASVMGLPLSTWIGGEFGWRAAFGLVAALALVSAVWVWISLPTGIRPPSLSRQAWGKVLSSPVLMGIVAVTTLQGAGQFVLFSYFAPLLKANVGATTTQLSLFWGWFGLCGLVGNMIVSRNIDRIGPARMVALTMAMMVVSLVLWPLGHTLVMMCAIGIPWGLACFAANSAQQARLVGRDPALAGGSIALNTSGIYTGQAIGSAAGGWMLAHDASSWMSWVGAATVTLGILLSLLIERTAKEKSR